MEPLARVLAGGERSEAGPAVASRGLTLTGVGYENLDFEGGAHGAG
jgi:hypothetical protein